METNDWPIDFLVHMLLLDFPEETIVMSWKLIFFELWQKVLDSTNDLEPQNIYTIRHIDPVIQHTWYTVSQVNLTHPKNFNKNSRNKKDVIYHLYVTQKETG